MNVLEIVWTLINIVLIIKLLTIKDWDYSETGFLQVFFVAINTYFITKKFYARVVVVSFLISFIWSFNVKKVAFGSMTDRFIYSLGAAIGGVVGLILSSYII